MKRITFIISLFLLLGIQKEVQSQNKSADKGSKQVLRILTYNIHHGNPPSKPDLIDLDAIARVIIESKADIVALQEVETGVNRSGGVNEAKLLGEKTGLHYQFFKAIDHDGGDYGVAILSRYKFQDVKLVPLPQEIIAEKRVLGYLTIKIGKQQFIFCKYPSGCDQNT